LVNSPNAESPLYEPSQVPLQASFSTVQATKYGTEAANSYAQDLKPH